MWRRVWNQVRAEHDTRNTTFNISALTRIDEEIKFNEKHSTASRDIFQSSYEVLQRLKSASFRKKETIYKSFISIYIVLYRCFHHVVEINIHIFSLDSAFSIQTFTFCKFF